MACQHIRIIGEQNDKGIPQTWCLDCPHTWISLPLNINLTKPSRTTETSIYVDQGAKR